MKKLILLIILAVFTLPFPSYAQTCNLNVSGDLTFNSNCSIPINSRVGIDDGAALDSTSPNRAVFKVGPGVQVSIGNGSTLSVGILDLTGGGTIIYPSTFNILIGQPVWVLDGDGDGLPGTSAPAIASATRPTGTAGQGLYYRKKYAIDNNLIDSDDTNSCPPNACKSNCQKCVNGSPVNVAAGNACNTATGVEVSVTTAINCGTSIAASVDSSVANACSGVRTSNIYYRACNGSGSCYADNTSAALSVGNSSTIYAPNGKVFTDTIGTTATPDSNYKCNTADVTVGGQCSGTRNYRACNGVGSCRNDNIGAGTGTIYAPNGKIYTNSVGGTGAASVSYYCGTSVSTDPASSVCSGTRYYHACNGSGGCRGDTTGAGTATFYAPNASVIIGYAGETSPPDSTHYCSISDATAANACTGTRYYRPCGGSGGCRVDNVGAASATLNAPNGKVFTSAIGTTANPSSTYKCGTIDATAANTCSGTRYYKACNGAGSCYNDTTNATSGTLWAANGKVFTNATGTTAAPNGTYKCNTVDVTAANACSGTRNYRACNGIGSCRNDNTGAGTATIYAANGKVYTNATGTTAAPNSTYKCASITSCTAGYCFGTNYFSACDGSGGCRNDTVGAGVGTTFLVANGSKYDASCNASAGSCSGGNLCTTFWQDADNDTYGSSSSTANYCGSSPPAGYVAASGNNDCCDSNASIYPNNSNYYTSAHAACTGVASDWDYDCDSSITYAYGVGNTQITHRLVSTCSGSQPYYNYRLDGCSSGWLGFGCQTLAPGDCGQNFWVCTLCRIYTDGKTESRKGSCTNVCDSSMSAWAATYGWTSCAEDRGNWQIKCR
jgi:hypothetical protein